MKIAQSQSSEKYYVQKKLYTYADGLPGREVTCAAQDKNGYIWFGTKNGLCRFNGQSFKIFTQKSHGLYQNHIRALFSDDNHGLIITYESKANRFIDTINHIDVIDINSLELKSFDNYYVNSPFKQQNISQITYSKNRESLLFNLKPFFHLNLKTFEHAVIWERSKSGVFKKKTRNITKTIKFILANNEERPIANTYNSSIDMDDKCILLFNDSTISFNGQKLIWEKYACRFGFVFDHIDSLLKHHYYSINKSGKISSLDSTDWKFNGIRFSPNVQYYHAFTDRSVFSLDKSNTLKLQIPFLSDITVIDSTDNELIKKARILNVLIDILGNRWLCTTEGVIKVIVKKQKFKNYFTLSKNLIGKNHSARGILAFNGFLFTSLYDFVAIQKNDVFDSLNFGSNFSILKTGNTVWLGSYFLRCYDLKTKKTVYKNQFKTGELWSMCLLNNNQLLLGGTENIKLYDIAANTATSLKNGTTVNPELVYRFFYNSKKQLMAVANNGIFLINSKAEIVDFYSNTAKTKNRQLPFSDINDLFQDKDGMYWFATANEGIYKWNLNNHTFEQFGIDNGFLSETTYRIEEDKYGKLWISTDFGLAKFDKTTHKAQIFTETDGISHNEFNRSSSYKDEYGNLYFGGIDGITSFNPADFESSEYEHDYPLLLNNISRYNSKTDMLEDETQLFYNNNKINLTDDRKNITILFSLLDLEERAHLYAYQIDGISKEWNYIREGKISIAALPYGKYLLHIKAQCSNGSWNKTEITIPLNVIKPFYKSWWFIICIIISIVLLSIVLLKYRIKKLRRQNEKLEFIIESRTAELKESLAEQISLLQEVHHRVKNNLQFIAAMLKMQINSIQDEGNKTVLTETSRRINSMSLVHEMLYNKEKLENIYTKEYLIELVSKLQEMVYDSSEPIFFNLSIENVKFDVNNCVAIGMITSEIISNSIKHAFNKTQKATIIIILLYNDKKKSIVYSIQDNGPGLLVDKNNSGLGMRLIDIFARQMEATYEVENINGLKYTFTIPYEKNEK